MLRTAKIGLRCSKEPGRMREEDLSPEKRFSRNLSSGFSTGRASASQRTMKKKQPLK